MSLTSKIKRKLGVGLFGLLGVGAAASQTGCVFDVRDGDERLRGSAVIFPLIVGGVELEHTMYQSSYSDKIESALHTRFTGTLLTGEFEMKVYGEDKTKLWSYKCWNEWGKPKTVIYGSQGQELKKFDGVPDWLPAAVKTSINLSGNSFSIRYSGYDPDSAYGGSTISYRRLSKINPETGEMKSGKKEEPLFRLEY